MIILRVKNLIKKLFSNTGNRSGYPSNFSPKDIFNPKNLPIEYDIKPLKSFNDDLPKHVLKKVAKSRISKLILSLGNGYIFKNNPNDSSEYTHGLGKFGSMDIYSKDISTDDRLIYGVKTAIKLISGITILVITIRLIGNHGHKDKPDLENILGKKK